MSNYICHDFKTPRTDTSRRLPNSFRAVPVFFYLAIVAGAYFITTDIFAYRKATAAKTKADDLKTQHEATAKKHTDDKNALDVQTARAEAIARWIEGTRVVQPISVRIARSLPPEVHINELYIERNEQLPSNLNLSLKLTGGSLVNIQTIEKDLTAMNYRTNGSQQTTTGEQIDYRTSLSWQNY